MKSVWEKIAANAADAKAFVEEVSANGIEFLKSNIEQIPLFSSTHADVNEKIDRDETHYFLVPNRQAEANFALYTIRSLPPGITPVNSLEKARIFHLHDSAGINILESLLISDHKSEIEAKMPDGSPNLADRLDELANRIDKSSNTATEGVIIVGSLVAIANPLLGVGIMISSALPFATTAGIKALGDKFRKSVENKQDRKTLKQAEKDVKRLKAEVFVNPVLRDFQLLISAEKPSPELAILQFEKWNAAFGNLESLRLTARAMNAVFQDDLTMSRRKSKLSEVEFRWLNELNGLAAATEELT